MTPTFTRPVQDPNAKARLRVSRRAQDAENSLHNLSNSLMALQRRLPKDERKEVGNEIVHVEKFRKYLEDLYGTK